VKRSLSVLYFLVSWMEIKWEQVSRKREEEREPV